VRALSALGELDAWAIPAGGEVGNGTLGAEKQVLKILGVKACMEAQGDMDGVQRGHLQGYHEAIECVGWYGDPIGIP
jgi:hypothetical protein